MRIRRRLRVCAGLAPAFLVACMPAGSEPVVEEPLPILEAVVTDDLEASEAPVEAMPSPLASEPTPPPTPTPTPEPPPDPPVIALTGDVHGEAGIRRALADGENPFDAITPLLAGADVTAVNLETAVAEQGSPADKQFTFLADPALLPALAGAGVDVVSLANNHALDYGMDALLETRDRSRAAGLHPVGAGDDADEAYAPAVVEVRGATVAFLGVSRVLPEVSWKATPFRPGIASAYEEGRAVAAVEAATALADHVIVLVHWGAELAPCPDEVQRGLARALVAAGADVVAGHHPHVLQGITDIDGAVVAYSLGNFAFTNNHLETRRSMVLEVVLGVVPAVTVHPVLIGPDAIPAPAEDEEAGAILRTIAQRSPGGETGCPGP